MTSLALCQRYFETRYFTILGTASAANSYGIVLVYLAPKRVNPTITLFNTTTSACSAPALAAVFPDGGVFFFTQSTAASGGYQASGQFTANAEI